MSRFAIPSPDLAAATVGAVLGALTWEGGGPTALQLELTNAILSRFSGGTTPDVHTYSAWEPEDVAVTLVDPAMRREVAHIVVTMELLLHPLPVGLERHANQYLNAMGVGTPYLDVVRDTAEQQMVRLHADLLRNSWYTEQTIHGIFKGRFAEMVRSKLSYYSVGEDRELAAKWRALEQCPEGSWGHTVSQFYRIHGFAYPGEHDGIYEVGALHDWIHVLADYGTSPEGEIDVFAFIAATMEDDRGFIQFIFTLALFQNASVTTVGGRHVTIARADTMSDPQATDRLAGALYRASKCTADVMGGVDHFALADTPLDELRERWSIPPKLIPGPGALDVP
ncbi:hypothetical protein BH10ACT3_BH10ACT3_15370 [soil metagenome]